MLMQVLAALVGRIVYPAGPAESAAGAESERMAHLALGDGVFAGLSNLFA